MMKRNSIHSMLSVLLCVVLIAALALFAAGCGAGSETPETSDAKTFTFQVVDADGKETTQEITTTATTVGEALLAEGLIEGEEGPYGLYVKTVCGTTLDYETDGKYWAFYVDGEYGLTGVELTDIVPGTVYSFRAE